MILYRKKLLIAIISLSSIVSCAQKENKINPVKMEKEIIAYQNKMYDKIQKFDKNPLYILQVNKNNCRVLITCNDIPHWMTFYNNIGESNPVFLNNYIPKSGIQMLRIQVFPKQGETYIAENADLNLKLLFSKDKNDGVDKYTSLMNAELPEDIGQKKLPYYEIKMPFDAKVPWDFSKDLELAQDLSKIVHIENKVVAKYEQLRSLLLEGDGLSFLKEVENSDLKSSSHLYATKEELLADDKEENMDITRSRLDVKNRIVKPIDNYEILFFHNKKLALLRDKNTKDDILNVEYDDPNGQGKDGASKPVILYMPAGTNEFKVW